MRSQLSKRFAELIAEAERINSNQKREYNSFINQHQQQVDSNLLLGWKVKAKSLLSQACGADSIHFIALTDAEDGWSTSVDVLARMLAVVRAAQEDFDGGYLASVRSLIQAEVFSTELEQATELLAAGYKIPAAVVAGVVLETALRNLSATHHIDERKWERMNEGLCKAGVYNAIVKKRITSIGAVRNSAAHGKSDEFDDHAVSMMISEVEHLLADFLS